MVKLQPIIRSNEKCFCFQKRYLSNIAKDQAVAGPARFLPPRWGIIGRIRYLLLQNAPLPAPRVQNSNKIKMRALCFAYNLVIYRSHGRGWLSFNSHCTEKDGMPANVNRNKSGTKNTTPRLRCQERIHQSNLFAGKEWYCAINLSCSGEWYSAIYFSFCKGKLLYWAQCAAYLSCIIEETAENRAWPPRSSQR